MILLLFLYTFRLFDQFLILPFAESSNIALMATAASAAVYLNPKPLCAENEIVVRFLTPKFGAFSSINFINSSLYLKRFYSNCI